MDELVQELVAKAGLDDAQAKAAVEVFLEYMKHEEHRKKVIQAAVATTIASAVVVGTI
jgi:nucleoid DNA-binding protein